MNKRIHKILCYLITISLVVMPFSIPAEVSLKSVNKEHCPEMTSNNPEHVMNMSSMKTDSNDVLMDKSDCCENDRCNGSCCTNMSGCGNGTSHASSFIVSDYIFTKTPNISQSAIEYRAQYQSQITNPDYRPPIV